MEPRYLTEDEIADIVSVIPLTQCPSLEIAVHMRNQDVEMKTRQLRNIKLAPDGITMMKQTIVRQFYQSLPEPGEPVGAVSGSGFGAVSTQLTLNTFHVAGSDQTVASGVDALKQTANSTQERKVEKTTIHFNDTNMTRAETHRMGLTLKGVTISDLLTPSRITRHIHTDSEDWWYSVFRETVGLSDKYCLDKQEAWRLHMNVYDLYMYNISLDQIAEILKESLDHVVVIWAPPHLGYIDVFLEVESAELEFMEIMGDEGKTYTADDVKLDYFRYALIPVLKSSVSTLNGIKGLKDISVQEKSVMTYSIESKQLGAHKWSIWFDTIKVHVEGLPHKKIEDLLRHAKITIDDIIDNPGELKYDITLPDTAGTREPIKYINALISEADDALDTQRTEQRRVGNYSLDISDGVYKSSKYSYVVANSREFAQILSKPDVDSDRTICWNANVVLKVLGIEAAYNVILREFYDTVIGNGGNIAVQNPILLARAMTYTGAITAITSKGASAQRRDAYSASSFDSPITTFTDSATYGHKEQVHATSGKIFVGAEMKMGTGSIEIGIDHDMLNAMIDRARPKQTEVDLSVFRRGDLSIVDNSRNVVAENQAPDTIVDQDITYEATETLVQNVDIDIPDVDIDFTEGFGGGANWINAAKRGQSSTAAEITDYGALIDDLLDNVF